MFGSVDDVTHILIADDHDLFRRGLRYALTDRIDSVKVTEVGSFDEALTAIAGNPEITLASFDLRMPGMQLGQSLLSVRRLYPKLPIVVLSGFEDRQHVLSALQLGASGFIPKSLSAEAIVAAMLDILQGRIFIPASVIEVDSAATETSGEANPREPLRGPGDLSHLTQRQREVLERLLAGRSTKEIGRDLDLAEGTVKIHLAALFRMLGARNRVEAVSKAISLGFPPPRIGSQ